ncbi:MAG: nucleotidyltransferase domain-containing protein [Pseudomonadota bacterium]
MRTSHLQSITQYLEDKSAVKFAYLFGSCSRNEDGPLSDIDLAVYLDKRLDFFVARLRLMDELSRLLKGYPCDLVVLNTASLILQYEVIRGGSVVKENKKKRISFEIGVVREYLDTEPIRTVHLKKLKESFMKGQGLGQ